MVSLQLQPGSRHMLCAKYDQVACMPTSPVSDSVATLKGVSSLLLSTRHDPISDKPA